MLKRTVVTLAAAAFFWGTVPTQTAQARDDMWDLMNPSWWADKMFDNDDDDWLYYRYHRYSPYWGGPYAQRPRLIVIQQQQPDSKEQNPDTRLPE
jgi:hypothetical protein